MEEAAGWAGRWVGEEKNAVNGDNKEEARDAEDGETRYSPRISLHVGKDLML